MNEAFGMAEAENETNQYNYDVINYKLMDLQILEKKLDRTHNELCKKWRSGEVGENKVRITSDKIQSNSQEIQSMRYSHRQLQQRISQQDSTKGIMRQQEVLLHRIKSIKTVLRGIPKKQSTHTIDVLSGYISSDSDEEIIWKKR